MYVRFVYLNSKIKEVVYNASMNFASNVYNNGARHHQYAHVAEYK